MAEGREWLECRAIILDAIAACEDAKELESLFRSGGIDEVMFDEAPLDGELARAIQSCAQRWPAADGAKALSWLCTFVAPWPNYVISRSADVREDFVGAIDLALVRAWLVDRSKDRRIAAVHLLAFCPGATREDAQAMASRAAKEKNAVLLATELLTLGVLSFDPSLAREKQAHPDRLVRLCAAAARSRSGEVLDRDATLAVIEHAIDPMALPVQWGWRGASGPFDSDFLASLVIGSMRTDAPRDALAALAKVEIDRSTPLAEVRSRTRRFAIADTAFRLAFGSIPDAGLAYSELDEAQRDAVAIAAKLGAPIPALSMTLEGDVVDWITGRTLHERPLEVGGHRWHFARILGAVALGELSADLARDAVLALPDAEAADLAARWSGGRVLLDDHIRDEAARTRMLELCLSILAALSERGFDLDAFLRAALDDRSRSSLDVGILALACLRAHGDGAVPDFVPLLARAAAQGWWNEELLAHVRTLASATQRAIVSAIEPNVYALPYVELYLDGPFAARIVRWAAWSGTSDAADAAVRALSHRSAAVVKHLESWEAPPALREKAAAIVARVVSER